MYKYFSNKDFRNANPASSIDDMDSGFLTKLDQARSIAGVPFIINSAFRSIEHEKRKGRDGSSSHTKGLAVDIRVRNSRERFLILKGLIETGFHRIGIANTFIHVDMDNDKDAMVTWLYSR